MYKNSRLHKRQRAQSSAPIELVVAVIILISSMGLAFMVLQNTQSAQCTDRLKSQMRSLEAVMLDVALGSPSTSRESSIELSSCGSSSIEAIRVVYYDSSALCGKCPSTGGGCWIIEPLEYRSEQSDYIVVQEATSCINMPGKVQLQVDDVACTDSSLVSTRDTGDGSCPPDAKDHRSTYCGLAPAVASSDGSKFITVGKALGESQYNMRVTKAFDTAAGDPVLKVCFVSKRG